MLPILGYIGNIPIKTYYVFIIIGIILGFVLLYRNLSAGASKTEKNRILFFALIIFIPLFAGARIGYMLETRETGSFCCINSVFGPGSLWWGLAVACISAFLINYLLKLNIWKTADFFAPSIALGGFFTRLGCLANGCCFGIPCSREYFFGTYFSLYSSAYSKYGELPLHPTQFYLAVSWLLIFFFIQYRFPRKKFTGELILITGFLYGFFRFIIEFFRHTAETDLLSTAHYFCLFIMLLTGILYILKYTKNKPKNLTN
ncbi:MAG: prolipoprotein diacylglyceryl transferase [Candidatus Goldiibacteriota bacterium]